MSQRNRTFTLLSILAVGCARAAPIGPGFLQLSMPSGGASVHLQDVGAFSLRGVGIGGGQGDPATLLIELFSIVATTLGNYQAQVAAEAYLATGDQAVNGGVIGRSPNALFDLFLTINSGNFPQSLIPQPDQLPLSTGTMTLHQETDFGGTLDIVLKIFADVVFVDVRNPDDVVSMPLPMIMLTATDVPWVKSSADFFGTYATGGISLPQGISFVSNQPFFSGLDAVPATSPAPPEIPEPASILLVLPGMMLLARSLFGRGLRQIRDKYTNVCQMGPRGNSD